MSMAVMTMMKMRRVSRLHLLKVLLIFCRKGTKTLVSQYLKSQSFIEVVSRW